MSKMSVTVLSLLIESSEYRAQAKCLSAGTAEHSIVSSFFFNMPPLDQASF